MINIDSTEWPYYSKTVFDATGIAMAANRESEWTAAMYIEAVGLYENKLVSESFPPIEDIATKSYYRFWANKQAAEEWKIFQLEQANIFEIGISEIIIGATQDIIDLL